MAILQKDSDLCKKKLRIFDSESNEIFNFEYTQDTLTLNESGNFSYFFEIAEKPEITTSTYTFSFDKSNSEDDLNNQEG
jgi:hypothetical protein